MSVVVLFEAEFVPGSRERYLALAQKLAERARAADGFISAERFSSLTEFPAGSPGLEPREECGLSKFFLILAQTQPNHAHSFRLRYIQPL